MKQGNNMINELYRCYTNSVFGGSVHKARARLMEIKYSRRIPINENYDEIYLSLRKIAGVHNNRARNLNNRVTGRGPEHRAQTLSQFGTSRRRKD